MICLTIINESYIGYSMNIRRDRKPIFSLVMLRPYTTSCQSLVYVASNEYIQAIPRRICLRCPSFNYCRQCFLLYSTHSYSQLPNKHFLTLYLIRPEAAYSLNISINNITFLCLRFQVIN